MPWLERHAGCPADPMCFGPRGEYWTLFGTELRNLAPTAVLATLLALVLLGVLLWRMRTGRSRMRSWVAVLWTLAAGVALFLALAAAFPDPTIY